MTDPVVTQPIQASTETLSVPGDTAPAQAMQSDNAAPVVAPSSTPEPTLLGAEYEKNNEPSQEVAPKAPEGNTEDKTAPAETKADDATQNKEGSQSDEPAPQPTYDAFKLPDGTDIPAESMQGFTKLLGEFEVASKASHSEVQKLGQALIERHASELKQVAEHLATNMKEAHENNHKSQIKEWENAFKSDPELGGNRQDTILRAANEFIKTHGGTPEQQKEFREILETSGLGSHPAVIRILAKAMDSNSPLREGKPLPATAPIGIKDKIQKRYSS
jgi:hypothetical protein